MYGDVTATIYCLYEKTNKIFEISNILYAWFDRESSFSNHVLTSKHFNTFPKMIKILQSQMIQVPQFTEEFEYIIQSRVQIVVNYFKENKADTIELEREKENSIKNIEDLIKFDDENFYIYMNKYIDRKVNFIVSSYESTLSWKITKPIRKTKQILRKLLHK